MKFHIFFLILRKLCNAPLGSIGVDHTEITFHSSFGNPCPCHSLAQNPVSLIRMSSQNTDSHHFLSKRSWMAFRVEHSKHQRWVFPKSCWQKSSSWIRSQVRIGENTEILETAAFLSWIFSTMSDIITIFRVSNNSSDIRLLYCYIFTIVQTLSILCE